LRGGAAGNAERLTLYCAAVLKDALERIARQFEIQTGVRVQLQFGGSGTLLSNLRIAQIGDLYLPADRSYVDTARDFGLIEQSQPVAVIRPVIAVRHGNPKRIRSLDDLLRNDVEFALADPEAAAVGRVTHDLLERTGIWDRLRAGARVLKPTVNDVAGDVTLGLVDAAIVWDATVAQYGGLDAVRDARLDAGESVAAIAILKFSKRSESARRFVAFLTEASQARELLRSAGLQPASGP
jgi:molybdate transport system substrate-binding protein